MRGSQLRARVPVARQQAWTTACAAAILRAHSRSTRVGRGGSNNLPVVAVAAPALVGAVLPRLPPHRRHLPHRGAGGATPSTSLRRSSQPAAAIYARHHVSPRGSDLARQGDGGCAPSRPSPLPHWVSSDEQDRVNSCERQGLAPLGALNASHLYQRLLKLAVEMWKVELLTSHVPTTTTLVHYTDTKDLRDTCAGEIQHVVVGSSLRRWPQSGRQMRQPHTEPSRQGCAYDVLTLG